jgi:hypothetical protein
VRVRVARAARRRSLGRRSRKALRRFLRFSACLPKSVAPRSTRGTDSLQRPAGRTPTVSPREDRGVIAFLNRCTHRTVLARDPEIAFVSVPRSIVPPFHPPGYLDKVPGTTAIAHSQNGLQLPTAAEHPSQFRCGQPFERDPKLAGGWGRMGRCGLNGSDGQHWRRWFGRRSRKVLRRFLRFDPCHRTLKSGSALQRVRPVSTCHFHPRIMLTPTPTWTGPWGHDEPLARSRSRTTG